MHHALQIPEILAEIVTFNASLPGFLYTCLQVNSTFFHCAARILWHRCGADQSFISPHPAPFLRHLWQVDAGRRSQYYASLVRVLHCTEAGYQEEYTEAMALERITDECDFEWPNLEELEISGLVDFTDEAAKLRQFLQPRLKRLTLFHRSPVEDGLLELITERCPDLESLTLMPGLTMNRESEEAVIKILKHCKLRVLDIAKTGTPSVYTAKTTGPVTTFYFTKPWEKGPSEEVPKWGQGILDVLSQQPKLNHLSIPDLENGVIQKLVNVQEVTKNGAFAALTTLQASLSLPDLRSLHRATPHLTTLCLDMRNMSILTYACILGSSDLPTFPQLLDITLKPPRGAVLHGDDIVRLIKDSHSLTRLNIGKDDALSPEPFRGFDMEESTRPLSPYTITSDHISALASSCPHLQELYLLFSVPDDGHSSEDHPKESALEMLAKRCPNLTHLWLTCLPVLLNIWNMWWTPNRGTTLFPNLIELRIAAPFPDFFCNWRYDMCGCHTCTLGLGERVVESCPKLQIMEYLEPYPEDDMKDLLVMDAISERWRAGRGPRPGVTLYELYHRDPRKREIEHCDIPPREV